MENWNWTKLLLFISFIIFLGSLLLRQESAITQDLGRHLRLGEMIVSGGQQRDCALFTNCLTYTYPGYPFINHHWGSEVIFYLIYRLGGFGGLIVLKAIVLGLAFLITARHAIGNQKPEITIIKIITVITIIFLSIQMMADRLTTRPEIFGYLLFSLLFWVLDRRKLGKLGELGILGVLAIWVNLHISFIFGLALIWIWGISKLISKRLIIASVATLITLINPNGIRGALAPLNILKTYGYTIAENMTPFFMAQFRPQPEYWIYGGLLVITLLMWGIKGFGGVGVFRGLTLIVFSMFPLMAVRHLPFFTLIIPIVLTPSLLDLFQKVPYLYKVRHLTGYMAGGLVLLAITNPIPLAYAKLSPVGLGADKRYEAAIQFVKENNLQGKMWNNYDIGSYLEWALPEYKTFVDGRPEAFPVEFFRDIYKPMQEKPEIWNQETEKYDIQWIFAALTDTTPWFQQWWMMIQSRPEWKIVYLDDYSTILVKENGINKNVKPVGKAKTLQIVKNFDVLY